MSCNGNCSSCSGCARELVLTEKEIDFLNTLGQYAFLPVARTMGDLTPVYLEEGEPEEMITDKVRRSFNLGNKDQTTVRLTHLFRSHKYNDEQPESDWM